MAHALTDHAHVCALEQFLPSLQDLTFPLRFMYNLMQVGLCSYMTIEAGLLAYRHNYKCVPYAPCFRTCGSAPMMSGTRKVVLCPVCGGAVRDDRRHAAVAAQHLVSREDEGVKGGCSSCSEHLRHVRTVHWREVGAVRRAGGGGGGPPLANAQALLAMGSSSLPGPRPPVPLAPTSACPNACMRTPT